MKVAQYVVLLLSLWLVFGCAQSNDSKKTAISEGDATTSTATTTDTTPTSSGTDNTTEEEDSKVCKENSAGVSTVLLEENFNDKNTKNWETHIDSSSNFNIVNCELQQSNQNAGVDYSIMYYKKGFDWSDFEADFTLRHVSGFYSITALTFFFRVQEDQYHGNDFVPASYWVQIHGNGNVELYETDAFSTFELVERSAKTVVTPNYEGYKVKVIAVRDSIKVYVDGVLMIDAYDSTYSTGSVGFTSIHQVGAISDLTVIKK